MPETTDPQVNSPGIPFEVDGEVVYLSPNSAEGKALQRIRNPTPEDEWVTVEADRDIDMKAVRQQIKQRGYKTQVSAEDNP
jgi:hypothetical protein